MRRRCMDREERRALGLCTHGACTAPAAPGCVRCDDCLAAVRESSARFRARGGSRKKVEEELGAADRIGPYLLIRQGGRIISRRIDA